MHNTLAHIQYRDHRVHIAENPTTGHIVCFKYNQGRCDFAEFTRADTELFTQYITEPLPTATWGFIEDLD